MSKKNKSRFRVGQRVQSASDPTHTFVIDKSLVPERIFREKGSGRWWTKNELQTLGAPENPLTSTRLNGKGNACGMRAKCVRGSFGEVAQTARPAECLECGALFKPTRDWQKFDRPTCRYNYWRRIKSSRAEVPHRGLPVGFERQVSAERLN